MTYRRYTHEEAVRGSCNPVCLLREAQRQLEFLNRTDSRSVVAIGVADRRWVVIDSRSRE